MPELDWLVIAWCTLALVLGGTIKGTLGIGTPLLTVPMMAMVLPVHLAVTLMAVPLVLANGWQALHAGNGRYVARRFWPVFAAILAGTYAGAKILSVIEAAPLLITVGALVLAFTVLQYAQPDLRLPPRFERGAGVGFGLLGGLVGGLSSMFGPPLILYLVSLHLDKARFVGAISFLYVSAVFPWAITLAVLGILDARTALWSAVAAVPVMLGVLLGTRLRARVAEAQFRRFVLVILLLSGSAMLWRGLSA